jgi:hypothetical protein
MAERKKLRNTKNRFLKHIIFRIILLFLLLNHIFFRNEHIHLVTFYIIIIIIITLVYV